MNRIDHIFKVLRRDSRKALIGYITAGFPTKGSLRTLAPLLEKSGLDIIEIGVPFSDPIADGPTIQYASQVALKNGVTLDWILNSVKRLRQDGVLLPIILMSYCNPILAMGIDVCFRRANAAGVDGLILPDLIPEESDTFARNAKKHKVALIYLVSPTTPVARIRMIAAKTNGFLYAVSLTGVTGVRKALPATVAKFLTSVNSVSRKPVAVGFGITSPAQARAISRHADGIIIGSELIRQIEKSKHASFKSAVKFIKSLRRALDKEPSYAY